MITFIPDFDPYSSQDKLKRSIEIGCDLIKFKQPFQVLVLQGSDISKHA